MITKLVAVPAQVAGTRPGLAAKGPHLCDCVPTPWGVGSRTRSGAGFPASPPLQGS